MTTITSKEAQNHFGALIDKAQREPIVIERHGRPVAVVLSTEDYERLRAVEDRMWAEKAREGESTGYLTTEESLKFIQGMLSREESQE